MKPNFRLIYGLLALGILGMGIVAWQVAEHRRVRNSVHEAQLNRAHDIANSLAVVIRSQRRFGTVPRDRLVGALEELATSRELLGIAMLNPAGEVVASGGQTIDRDLGELAPGAVKREGARMTVAALVELGPEPPRHGSPSPEAAPGESPAEKRPSTAVVWQFPDPLPEPEAGPPPGEERAPTPEEERAKRRARWGRMRQLHPHFQSPEKYQEIYEKQGLHMMVLLMDNLQAQAQIRRDTLFRAVLVAVALLAAAGMGLAWRGIARSSQLQIRLARARSLNTHLRELNLAAAGLAHETRNPLNIVRSITQMTGSDPTVPTRARLQLQKALEELDRMTTRLNEFIDYSKPREPRLAAVCPIALARDVARTLETDFEDKGISFQAPRQSTRQVLADATMLRQVLFNLLLNASQAVPKGGTIQVRLTLDGPRAALEIVDNGPGVPPEAREDIFRPYFTLSDHGSGLGLAVVRQIVLAHGWEIACQSNPGGGSIFSIRGMETAASANAG